MHHRAWAALLPLLVAALVAAGGVATNAPAAPQQQSPAAGAATGPGPGPTAPGDRALTGVPAPPRVTADAWAVSDERSGSIVAGERVHQPQPLASLVKLMTAIIVVERSRGDELVPVPPEALAIPSDAATAQLQRGERYTVDELLHATLAHSANDAAIALAAHVGGDQEGFLELMRDEADDLGLDSMRFESPTGLDGDRTSVGSPADVVELMRVALLDPRIRTGLKSRRVSVTPSSGGEPTVLANRNLLLGRYQGLDAGKTGLTDVAGGCLVVHWAAPAGSDDAAGDTSMAAGGEDPQGPGELIVAVLGSRDETARFADARALLDWARPLRQRFVVATGGEPVGAVPVVGVERDQQLYVSRDVAVWLRVGQSLGERIVVPAAVEPPLDEGDEVGELEVLVDGKVVDSSPLFVAESVPEPSWRDQLERWQRAAERAPEAGWQVTREQGRALMEYLALA